MKTDSKPPASPLERRSGQDRRQHEEAPPRGWDRRRGVEPRRPEVVELDLTPSQWNELGGEALAQAAAPAAAPAPAAVPAPPAGKR